PAGHRELRSRLRRRVRDRARPCAPARLRAGDPAHPGTGSRDGRGQRRQRLGRGRTPAALRRGWRTVRRRMGLTQYYTATSLDGYIADEQHSLDWLFTREQDREGPLNYAGFIEQVGALALGSTTYEWVLAHEGKWPYELPSWVFTRRKLEAVPGVTFTSDDVASVHAELRAAAGDRNVWIVGGGDLA